MHDDIVCDGVLADRLRAARRAGASDWHWSQVQGEWWRCKGLLSRIEDDTEALDAGRLCAELGFSMPVANSHEVDAAITDRDGHRYRMQCFRSQDGVSLSVRIIHPEVRTPQQLGVPAAVEAWACARNGLILVGGATGAGKSTTLASLLMSRAEREPINAVTLEDPIEQRLTHPRSRIVQRELGRDFTEFAQGLRAALRQDPDVLLIGEIRDAQTLRCALLAAQSGHLLLASVHAQDAAQGVQRMLGLFNADERSTMRGILAQVLVGICVQEMHFVASDRRIAFEVMSATAAVRALIRDDRAEQLANAIATGGAHGMVLMDDSRRELRLGTVRVAHL